MAKVTNYKVGDIVRLKSGGPEMTVQEAINNMNGQETGKYWCQWFAGKKLERGNFPGESIEHVSKEEK